MVSRDENSSLGSLGAYEQDLRCPVARDIYPVCSLLYPRHKDLYNWGFWGTGGWDFKFGDSPPNL